MDRFKQKLDFTKCWMILAFLMLFSCNESSDPQPDLKSFPLMTKQSVDAETRSMNTIMALPVQLKSPKSKEKKATTPSLALVFQPSQLSLSITGCASGYDIANVLYDGIGIQLYTSDRNCKIGISSFQHNGQLFNIASGYSFNYNEGDLTLFESSNGDQFFVKVETQITSVLNASSEAVFRIVQIDSTQDLILETAKPVLRVVNSEVVVTEGSTSSLTFTLEKVTSSDSDYSITVDLGGTVDENDVSPMQQQILIPKESTSYDLTFTLLDDEIAEVSETLELSLSMATGLYYYGNYQLVINDDDLQVPASGQVIWLKPETLSSPIDTWVDQGGGAPHPANQSLSDAQASLANSVINGFNAAYFDGNNDLMAFDDHPEINTGGPYDDKVIAVVFRSSDNISSKQVVFEQGGSDRGLNIYIQGGNLYFNGWNLKNDDAKRTTPWAPVYVTAPVTSNTNYVAVLRYSYSNNRMSAYLQGNLIGDKLGIGRLFSENDDAAIGGVKGSTYYHNGTSDISFFKGHIAEFIYYNGPLTDLALQGLNTQLMEKYVPSEQVISLTSEPTTIKEEGSEEARLVFSRDIAAPEDLVVSFTLSGNATESADYETLSSYSVTIPAFELSAEISVQAIDDADAELTETLVVTLIDPQEPGVSLGSHTVSIEILDNDSYMPNAYAMWYRGDTGAVKSGNGNQISRWEDISDNHIDASQPLSGEQPDNSGLINGLPALYFDGSDRLHIPNNELVNSGEVYTQKSIAFAFKTSDNIVDGQVIFEQGDKAKGLNIHISSGRVYFNIWNARNDDKGATTPYKSIYLSQAISANTEYTGIFIYDFDGGGKLHLHFNDLTPQTISGVGKLFKHTQGVAIGASDGTRFFDNGTPAGNANFTGSIAELIYFNRAINNAEINEIQTYLFEKYLP